MEEIEDIIAAADEGAADGSEDEKGAEQSSLSWTLEEGSAIKQADRHVFLFREAVLPQEIREYFGTEGLQPGQKIWIVLQLGNRRFDAFIEKTVHTIPRTRMMWKTDFAAVLQQEYPQWVDYFRKNRNESGDEPYIQFTRTQDRTRYIVELEGVLPEAAAGESLMPLEAGNVVDNESLRAIFRCSLQGSMRWSAPTRSLVLVSDHTQPGNEDTWIGKVFHFTGTGVAGEEGPVSRQNKTLAAAKETGIRLFLFEVFNEGQFTYIGEVGLMDNPYRSRQQDSKGHLQDVLVFPLELKDHRNPPLVRKEPAEGAEVIHRSIHQAFAKEAVRELPPLLQPESESMEAGDEPDLFEPELVVAEYAKRSANGFCQLCGLPAPFTGHDGQPYLEVHHIVPLKEGGQDDVGNLVALCPNCHRKMHVLGLQADVAKLKKKAAPGN
jgi:5-methylcytosine-specific restriction protein A